MRIAERLSLPEWRMGAVCCMTGDNEELYARPCRNGQRLQIQIFLDGFSLADIRSGVVRARIDLGRQGYSREFLTRILFVTLARSIACSRSASPAPSSSTGFSLCDFDFRSSGKAHRLKSVLPKAALHRIAYRHIKLTSKKRIGIQFAFAGNEGQALQKKTGAVGLVHLRFCGARPCRLTGMSYHS